MAEEKPEIEIPQSEGQAKVLTPEVEFGNVEYKLKLIAPTEERIEHLASQMKWRLGEGNGEAFYEIGVEDGGMPKGLSDDELKQSIETLQKVAEKASAIVTVLRVTDGISGKVADVLVRQCSNDTYLEIRIAVVGNVDAGKTTTIGVLTHSVFDNGRGKARSNIFRHQHEVETGRTSSICNEIMGFDLRGNVVNYDLHGTEQSDIAKQSCKIINFSDLAGHERYLKTTLFGMSGHNPDYVMLMIGANMGCVGMTKEHLGCALALRVPVFVVITKIDLAPENVFKETLAQITKMLKSPGIKKIPLIIKSSDDIIISAREISSGKFTPIFCISNVSGKNVDLLKQFLNLLPSTHDWDSLATEPVQFVIDNDFSVTGVGTVASGTVTNGCLSSGETLLLGPNEFGAFTPCTIKSVHINRLPVKQARAGMTASVSLKKVERKQLRKGMILVHPSLKPTACVQFDAEVVILYHSTTMTMGYEAVVHCGAVRQAARIIRLDRAHLRTGDKATVTFEFLFFPEYLVSGSRIIFREGRAKGIGRVVATTPYVHNPGAIKTNLKKRSNSDPSLMMKAMSPPPIQMPTTSLTTTVSVSGSETEITSEPEKAATVKGFYVRDTKTDQVRVVFEDNYQLLQHEEFWIKELPLQTEELLKERRGRRDDPQLRRNKTQIVSVCFPFSSACKIIDIKSKKERVVFTHQSCFLQPSEEFVVLSLSGGRPKLPNQKQTIRLILNPSFMTDIFTVQTSDKSELVLTISYNYRFVIVPQTASEEEALSLFSIPDYVGFLCRTLNAKIVTQTATMNLADFAANAVQICERAVFGTEKTFSLPNRLCVHSLNLQSVVPKDETTKTQLDKLPAILVSKQVKK